MSDAIDGQLPDLILFTQAFPFGDGEQFLETEIGYLAEQFSRICIVPRIVHGRRRPVPGSGCVDTSLAAQHAAAVGRRLTTLHSGVSVDLMLELLASERGMTDWRVVKKAVRFRAAASRAERWLHDRLESITGSNHKPILYTYWHHAETLAAVLLKRRRPGTAVVTRVHSGDLYQDRHELNYLPFRPAAFAGIDRVYCVSQHGRRYLAERFPSYADRFRVARLGVDDPGFITPPSCDGRFRIVSCSFMVPIKRLELLVDSIASFARGRPDEIVWRHIGDGPQRSELEARCHERLNGFVDWRLLGALPNSEVMAFYRDNPVDVFVNVSASEGLPVSIMEAQSCGIPVIATPVGGTPEIVNEGNGLLLRDCPQSQHVADALEMLARDPDSALTRRRASRVTWETSCDARRNYTAFVEELHALGQAHHTSTTSWH